MCIDFVLHHFLKVDNTRVQLLLFVVLDVALFQQGDVLARITQYDEVTVE